MAGWASALYSCLPSPEGQAVLGFADRIPADRSDGVGCTWPLRPGLYDLTDSALRHWGGDRDTPPRPVNNMEEMKPHWGKHYILSVETTWEMTEWANVLFLKKKTLPTGAWESMETRLLGLPATAFRFASKKYYYWHGLMALVGRENQTGDWREQHDSTRF